MVIIVDKNGYQLDGPTEVVMRLDSIENMLAALGFDVEVVNGHIIEELLPALTKKAEKPRAIVANTVKAHGISFLENNKMSHQCVLTKKKYEKAVEDIKREHDGE